MAVDTGHSPRLPAARHREADLIAADLIVDRMRPRHAAATVVIGIGLRPVRPVPWDRRAAIVRTRVRTLAEAATGVGHQHPRLVHRWICGSRSCVRPLVAMADIRAEPAQPMAVPAALLRATAADRPATVGRAVHRAMAGAAAPVAAEADTIRRRVVEVDITPAAVVDTPVAAAVDTPAEAADTRVVVAAAVTPVAADMAAAIVKKLGDAKSLREAAT